MKLINTIVTIITLTLGVSGCSDYLDDDVQYTREEVVTESFTRSRGFLENIYPDYQFKYTADFSVDVLTDNSVLNIVKTPAAATGYWSPTYNPYGYVWQQSYDNIRQIYQYITLVHEEEIPYYVSAELINDGDAIIARYFGEAYFLKAFAEWELLKYFGGPSETGEMLGFPIVNGILENEDYISLKRDTYEDCYKQILKDLDTAIKYLPLKYTTSDVGLDAAETGRASGIAAYALKAKVALFRASPAFNTTNDVEKWKDAATLAEDVITENGGLKSLAPYDPSSSTNVDHLWRLRGSANSNFLEQINYPPTLFGDGTYNPSQNLVDAFPDSQGYPISDTNSSYDDATPYVGRDPRFYKFIFYNNDQCYNGESCTEAEFNPLQIFTGGLDNYGGFVNSVGTRTGYYLKKYLSNLDFDPSSIDATTTKQKVYLQLGLTELYLGYAEALNEIHNDPTTVAAGYTYSAKDVLKKIRQRAGYIFSDPHLDAASTNQSDFEALLRNERRIEMCFTSDRFHDLRRWKEIQNMEDIKGVKITKDDVDGSISYERVVVEERNYEEKNFYLPLPYNEVIKNSNLKQNKGW